MAPLSIALLLSLAPTVSPPPRESGPKPAPLAVAGDGFRASFPGGLRPERRTEGGRTVHVASSRDRGAFVSVTSLRTGRALACEVDDAGPLAGDDDARDTDEDAVAEDGGGDGGDEDGDEQGEEGTDETWAAADARRGAGTPRMIPFSTARGLRACSLAVSEPGRGAIALELIEAGEVVVSVTAVAKRPEEAARLARAVADSVVPGAGAARGRILDIPEADPRLLGCFQRTRGIGGLDTGVRIFDRRCLRADFTYVASRYVYGASTSYAPGSYQGPGGTITARSAVYDSGPERTGFWWYARGALTFEPDGGDPEGSPVRFLESGIVFGGEIWDRVR